MCTYEQDLLCTRLSLPVHIQHKMWFVAEMRCHTSCVRHRPGRSVWAVKPGLVHTAGGLL